MTTPKYVDEAVKALEGLPRYTRTGIGMGVLRDGSWLHRGEALTALSAALSEPRYTVDEFLEHLFSMDAYNGTGWNFTACMKRRGAIRAHFEPLKKGGR
jgi:hypothetical protein